MHALASVVDHLVDVRNFGSLPHKLICSGPKAVQFRYAQSNTVDFAVANRKEWSRGADRQFKRPQRLQLVSELVFQQRIPLPCDAVITCVISIFAMALKPVECLNSFAFSRSVEVDTAQLPC